MIPLRVLIVDDEPLARRRLEHLLREQPAVELAGTASDGVAAARMIAERAPHVVLLDIKMPGQSGLEVLDGLRARKAASAAPPIVIFVTAFDRFAVEAFDRAAFDYLLKPVEPARLSASLARAREALADRAAADRAGELEEILRNLRGDPASAPAASPYAREIWIPERGGRVSVPVAAIDWIAAERDYVRLHTAHRSFLIRQSIGALAERLDPAQFIRIHRSSLVRADRIVRIRQAAGRGAVILSTGAEVAVSRRHMGALKAMSSPAVRF